MDPAELHKLPQCLRHSSLLASLFPLLSVLATRGRKEAELVLWEIMSAYILKMVFYSILVHTYGENSAAHPTSPIVLTQHACVVHVWLHSHVLQAAQTVFSQIHLWRKRITEAVSSLPFFSLFSLCSSLLLCWTLNKRDARAYRRTQSVKPSGAGSLSVWENTEIRLELDCYRCVTFHPTCLKVERTHLSIRRGSITVWVLVVGSCLCDPQNPHSVRHMFYANARCILRDTATCEGFIRKIDSSA